MNKVYETPSIHISMFDDYIVTQPSEGYTAARSVQGQMMQSIEPNGRAGVYTTKLNDVLDVVKFNQ